MAIFAPKAVLTNKQWLRSQSKIRSIPINPSEMLCVHNQIKIRSNASEKNLTSRTDFYKPRPSGT